MLPIRCAWPRGRHINLKNGCTQMSTDMLGSWGRYGRFYCTILLSRNRSHKPEPKTKIELTVKWWHTNKWQTLCNTRERIALFSSSRRSPLFISYCLSFPLTCFYMVTVIRSAATCSNSVW